ncbi:hypothetical protein IAT38_000080 [Cryptococcus sp. DSM 104549]
MACESTPVSTLFGSSTTLIPTTITTSTPVVVTPQPTTSTWLVTSCTTSTNDRAGFGNLLVETQGTSTSMSSSSVVAADEHTLTAVPSGTAGGGEAGSSTSVGTGTGTSEKREVTDVVDDGSATVSSAAETTSTEPTASTETATQSTDGGEGMLGAIRVSESATSKASGDSTEREETETTGQASGTEDVYSSTPTVTTSAELATETSSSAEVASTSPVDSGDGLGAVIANTSPYHGAATPLISTTVSASAAAASHTAHGWTWDDDTAGSPARSHSRDRRSPAHHASSGRHLRARQFSWGGNSDSDSDSDDVETSCRTITSTTTIQGAPTTTWETRYVTSSRVSLVSIPTETVYGGCESASVTESSTSSVDGGQATASSSQDWGQDEWASATSSSDDWWDFVTTDSSSSSWAESSSTESSTSSVSTESTAPSTLASLHSSSVLPSSTYIISTTTAPTVTADQAAGASTSAISSTGAASPASGEHTNKSVSTGAAVGGVFGVFALIAFILFCIRWWKKRKRVERTRHLRSSWFYGGDAGDIDDDFSEKSAPPPQNPQSRFSAPSMLSRHSLAIPAFLSRPISHMRQSSFGSTRFPPILSLKHLRNSILPSKAEENTSALGFTKRKQPDANRAWADKYTDMPAPVAVSDAWKRRISPPRSFMMSPPRDSQTGSPFQMGAGGAGLGSAGPYPSGSPGISSPPKLELNRSSPVTWGSSYATPQAEVHPLPWGMDDGSGLAPDVRVIAATPSNASHSVYSRTSTTPALSRGGTMKSTRSDGESFVDASGVGAPLGGVEAASFPLPPLTYPASSPSVPPLPVTQALQTSTPPRPAPPIPSELPFPPPNFSHPNPGPGHNDAHRITRSTAHSSGIWEYAAYADSGVGSAPNTGRESQQQQPQQTGWTGEADGRVTRHWYEKSLWDGSNADPASVYDVSVYGGGGHDQDRGRKSVKSVRWEDDGQDLADMPRVL